MMEKEDNSSIALLPLSVAAREPGCSSYTDRNSLPSGMRK